MSDDSSQTPPPNFLIIMVDQLRYPQKPGSGGFDPDIEQILSFVDQIDPDNSYAAFFPGFRKLREYAVVFTDHTIAESACIPSRASIMTGQYGPRTGVTQTDGLFKSGDAHNFPWLKAGGTPTMGDWFRALGYTTHYFGKWHVSDSPEHTLQGFGFGDWELSWPEPHGSLVNNLGTYRDYQFADLAATFLRARGLGVPYDRATSTTAGNDPGAKTPPPAPFLAVCSFTNPHDIATYPALPRTMAGGKPGTTGAVPVPEKGQRSTTPQNGTFQVPLNPDGFPQDCATAPATMDEDLLRNNKPRAQFEYSIKCGLGLAAKTGLAAAQGIAQQLATREQDPVTLTEQQIFDLAVKATLEAGIPFQTQQDPNGDSVGFLQYYAYMIYMVDRHILRVLEALEEAGLRESTIVVFMADHGEYGAAHSMMIEKWHAGYQEALAVPFLVSHSDFNPAVDSPIAIGAQTSHIDVLPTLLGLAGATSDTLDGIRRNLSMNHRAAPLAGANLARFVNGDDRENPVTWPDGRLRRGVLFATDDMITEPLPRDDDPHNTQSWQQYEVYLAAVEKLRAPGATDRPYLQQLQPGPVPQPNHVRALRSGPWKLVRYCDPWSEKPVPDEWELYNLDADSIEKVNLLVYNGAFPTPIADDTLKTLGLNQGVVVEIAQQLRAEMSAQEAALLSPYPSAHPSAGI